ncbi:hypothetical protein GCM10008927_06380 [Amylibacter ulvae]|uniref:Imm33-like domain-containing protein n=1 Tax=Paramylibacter ulvae TaxID=1651968 RepID=A0ABQ3CU95_9RHOB|nr:hypothetical protein [Amylibacter ulvae]GHA44319.1 hypothetical protein GCM10008927_06380 [Amylibacter ulvae]
MNEHSIAIKSNTATFKYSGAYSDEVLFGVQKFVNEVLDLNVGEVFYFGMWPVKLCEIGSNLRLYEYDFDAKSYVDNLDKSLKLWQEQSAVNNSQKIDWHSIELEHQVFFTPNAFNLVAVSTIEGIRDIPKGEHDCGWFVYTAMDQEQGNPFLNASLGELLKQYNLNVLRFLGLPSGWMFNIEISGNSHVWKEAEEQEILH